MLFCFFYVRMYVRQVEGRGWADFAAESRRCKVKVVRNGLSVVGVPGGGVSDMTFKLPSFIDFAEPRGLMFWRSPRISPTVRITYPVITNDQTF